MARKAKQLNLVRQAALPQLKAFMTHTCSAAHVLRRQAVSGNAALQYCQAATGSVAFEPEAADMIMRKLEKKQGQHSQLFLCSANPAQKLGSIYRWKPSLGSAMHILRSPAGSSVLLVAVQLQVSVSTTLRPVRYDDRVRCWWFVHFE